MLFKRQQPEDVMQKATQLVQRGETVRAEELLLNAAQDARKRYGPASPQHASAQNDLGSLYNYLGQEQKAVEALRAACAGPMPPGEPDRRDRLTYLMNLGTALEGAEQLEEAEQVFRQGLAARRDFYGQEHAGYAFGLEPLAGLLLRRGKLSEARQAIEETVANFWRDGHPRLAGALALRAEIMKAERDIAPPFAGLDSLPDNLITDIALALINRIRATDPLLSRQALTDVLDLTSSRLGETDQTTLNVLATLANLERDLGERGDPQNRQRLIRRAWAAYDSMGRKQDALNGVLALALAQADAGDQTGALASYADALARVKALPDLALHAQVERNYGLALADNDQRTEAETLLRQSADSAERAKNPEMQGRALTALGIFLQHGGDLSTSRPLLDHALRLLPPTHSDAVYARAHLHALDTGRSCGCNDIGPALADQFRNFVLAQLPQDLLENLEVDLKDNDFSVGVHLNRKPTDAELEHLNRVIHHALHEFRKRLSSHLETQ